MKTAIMELHARLLIDKRDFPENKQVDSTLEDIQELLEIEKQQIIKAYDDAFKYVVGGGFVAKTGKQYFEETYNDKK